VFLDAERYLFKLVDVEELEIIRVFGAGM